MIVAVAIIIFLALSLIVLSIIIHWKIFEKAGEPGWAVIVPLYNLLLFLKIVNKPWWWIFLLLIPIANIVLAIILIHRLSRSFGKDEGFTVGILFLNIIFLAILAFDKSTYTKLED
jgi:hypothetical protein